MTPTGYAAIRQCVGLSATGQSPGLPRRPARWPLRDKVAEPAREPRRSGRSARPVDRQGAPTPFSEDYRARYGFEREPDLRGAGGQRLQRAFRLHLLSPAVRFQPTRRSGTVRPAPRQRAQCRRLARGAGAGDRPLPGYREASVFPGRRGLSPTPRFTRSSKPRAPVTRSGCRPTMSCSAGSATC